ncbi:hypothetical protein P389DRAFT_168412 [Cystobasidium minutum MCA 4210]|uniref:uncharacterized protein n=1 Tax=Cystobasidium minutum MCA 4210 TaxID=1397322 RepID=UPI0034CD465E|eukprot:jgi/Rhomi1/168412/fgenesh1_kg.2_\
MEQDDGSVEPAAVHSSASSFVEQLQNERQTLLSASSKISSGSDKIPGYRTFAGLDGVLGNSQSPSGTSTPRDTASSTAKKTIKRKIKNVNYWTYYIPILGWLPEYSLRLLPGDIAAGLTITCLLVPQSMSYASGLARLDPVNGLFGVIVPAFIYVIFGTCKQLSVGPEAALSLLIGQTADKLLVPYDHYSPERLADMRIGIASVIVFEVGLITFLLGLFRLGFMDAVLSRALLRGFITAVGFVILIEQLIPLLGLSALAKELHADRRLPIDKFFFVVRHIKHTHRLTALVSLVALVILLLAKIVKPKLIKRYKWVALVPEILIVVVIATFLTDKFDWDVRGLAILGKVSPGSVHLHPPIHSSNMMRFAISPEVTSVAVTIALVGYVDSIVAAKESASRFNYPISPNRELTALGLANLGASLVSGTIPGFGSITRSRITSNAGARSPLYSFFVGLFTLLSTYFLLGYLYYLPKAVLACIISLVVYSILAECPEEIAFFVRMRAWSDMALMFLTFALTLFVSVETGILVSVAISLVSIVRQSARSAGVQIMGRVPGTEEWLPVEDEGNDDDLLTSNEEVPGALIVRLKETLHFANAGALKERLRRLERYGTKKHHPSDAPFRDEAQVVVFHVKDLQEVDASALHILRETCQSYLSRGVQVYFAHVSYDMERKLELAEIVELIGKDHMKASVKECLQVARMATVPTPAEAQMV